MKRCSKCSECLPFSAFGKLHSSGDGLKPWCKACTNAAARLWRSANPTKAKAIVSAWRDKNQTKHRQTMANYKASHSESIRKQAQAYRAAHPEKIKEWAASFRKSHLSQRRDEARSFAKANPGKRREYGHRRRARIQRNFVEPIELAVLMERDAGRCSICHEQVPDKKRFGQASIDHIVPISLGGAHSYLNTRLTHLRCNYTRHLGPAQQRMLA